MSAISAWFRRAQIPHYYPHRGGGNHERHQRTYRGIFSAYSQALRDLDFPEKDIRVLSNVIPTSFSICRGGRGL